MSKAKINGIEFNLPPKTRLGDQVYYVAQKIMQEGQMALHAAMDLRGAAKLYEKKYWRAFINFANANPDKLKEGPFGPRGGFGYKYIGPKSGVKK